MEAAKSNDHDESSSTCTCLTLVLTSPSQMTEEADDGAGAASGFTAHSSGFFAPTTYSKGRQAITPMLLQPQL
jgi:hypothetical protein